MSGGLWKRQYGGDRRVVGKLISLDGESYTVIGVMPSGFQSRPPADVWTPLRPVFDSQDVSNAYLVLVRLNAGITLETAQEDMEAVTEQLRREFPNQLASTEKVAVSGYHDQLVGDVRPALLVLTGAVGFVLMIACGNVAKLLLSRATARTREVAIRAALGAGRSRLIRQLLTESVVLGLVGGTLGLLLARWGLTGLLALTPANLPRLSEISMDDHVLAFTLLTALLTSVLCGLAPALQTAKIDLNVSLGEASGRSSGRARHRRLRNLLVVTEIGLSLVLLVGAGLLVRTFANLRAVDPGFDPRNVLTMKMSLNGSKYKTTAGVDTFFRHLVERLEALPGVETAAFVTTLPLELGPNLPFEIEGRQGTLGVPLWRAVTPRYFRATSSPLRRARNFTQSNTAQSHSVVIINEVLARQYFSDQSPIGERLTIGGGMGPDFADRSREIVGVVENVREEGLEDPPPAMLFIPASQVPDTITRLFNKYMPTRWSIRTKVKPMSLSARVRNEVLAVDAAMPVSDLHPIQEVLTDSIARQRFNMLLLG